MVAKMEEVEERKEEDCTFGYHNLYSRIHKYRNYIQNLLRHHHKHCLENDSMCYCIQFLAISETEAEKEMAVVAMVVAETAEVAALEWAD